MQKQTSIRIFRNQEKKRRYSSGSFYLRIGLLALFLLVPFLFPSYKTVDLAIKIVIFASLVASFDIMLGYTGILSFGHGMFFGIGAYCVAFLLEKYGSPTYLNLILGLLLAAVVAAALGGREWTSKHHDAPVVGLARLHELHLGIVGAGIVTPLAVQQFDF